MSSPLRRLVQGARDAVPGVRPVLPPRGAVAAAETANAPLAIDVEAPRPPAHLPDDASTPLPREARPSAPDSDARPPAHSPQSQFGQFAPRTGVRPLAPLVRPATAPEHATREEPVTIEEAEATPITPAEDDVRSPPVDEASAPVVIASPRRPALHDREASVTRNLAAPSSILPPGAPLIVPKSTPKQAALGPPVIARTSGRQDTQPRPPDVTIAIGHIEVRAAPPPAPRRSAAQPRVTLSEFLRRSGGKS
jgi:hypothetical protein